MPRQCQKTQGATTVQTLVVTTNQNVTTAMGSSGPPIPGTPQLRNPPRPTQAVTTIAQTLAPTQTTGTTTISSLVPQTPIINISHIQDKTPQTTVSVKQVPMSMTPAAPTQKVAVAVRRRRRPRNQPVATCQVLETIEEVNEDSPMYFNPDFGETESEAADLC